MTACNTTQQTRWNSNTYIGKTYGLLVLSLLTMAWGVSAGLRTGIGNQYFWLVLIGAVAALIVTIIVQQTRGLNLLALLTFSGFAGLALSIPANKLVALGCGNVMTPAFLLTGALFTALSAYAVLTKDDLPFGRSFLFAGLCVVAAGWIFHLIFPAIPLLGLGCAGMGVLLFSGYTLFHTQTVVLQTNDPVHAALVLHLDFYNLLLNTVRILLEVCSSGVTG